MIINKKMLLNASVNDSILNFSRSVDMGEIEVFIITLIKEANDSGEFRTIGEILKNDFGFNDALTNFYTGSVLDHLVNTEAITVEDPSVDFNELLPAEININKAILNSIKNETFKTTEVKRNKKHVTFVLDPISNVLAEATSFEKGKPNLINIPKEITNLKLDGVKERWIREIHNEIYINEDFSENSQKVINKDVSIDLNFNTNSIVIKEGLKDFLIGNKLVDEFFEFMTSSFKAREQRNDFEFVSNEELLRQIDKKCVNNVSVLNEFVYEVGSKEFKPTNFDGVSLNLPAFNKTLVLDYIKKLDDDKLKEFSNIFKLEKEATNEIIENRKMTVENYEFVKPKISNDVHQKILSNNAYLISNANIGIYLEGNVAWKDLLNIVKDNHLSLADTNLNKYSFDFWNDIKEIRNTSVTEPELKAYFNSLNLLSNLEVKNSNIEKAKEYKKLFDNSINVFKKRFNVEASPLEKEASSLMEGFLILEQTELKSEIKMIASEVRDKYEGLLKEYKNSNKSWVAENIDKLDGPSQKAIKKAWQTANKFHHFVEKVNKDDLRLIKEAKGISEKVKIRKEEKHVS